MSTSTTKRAGADDVVRARVNSDVKAAATAILASIGLTPSDAYRMLLARIVAERALPFEPLKLNEETIAAMFEPRANSPRHTNAAELLAELDAPN